MTRDRFARGSQLDAGWKSFEQRYANLGLEVEDLTIDGGRRDVQSPGGFADRTGTANRIEIKQCSGVNAQILELRT